MPSAAYSKASMGRHGVCVRIFRDWLFIGGEVNMKATHPSEEKFLQKFKKLPETRKNQVLDFMDFLARKKPRESSEGDVYAASLEALRLKIQEKGGLIRKKGKDQVIKKLRATRETIWKEDYADHFRQQ
jgi:hypothetical protein